MSHQLIGYIIPGQNVFDQKWSLYSPITDLRYLAKNIKKSWKGNILYLLKTLQQSLSELKAKPKVEFLETDGFEDNNISTDQ